MINYIGMTEKDEKVYSLSDQYGVDESGMIVKIDNDNDTFIFTKYYIDAEIKEETQVDYMKKRIVNLKKAIIEGYELNLFDFELDGAPYIQLIKGSPEEESVLEKTRELPIDHQFFARNKDAVVFIHIDGNSAVIRKDHSARFHKTNTEEGNKKLIAILKSVSCQFEVYENFSQLDEVKF